MESSGKRSFESFYIIKKELAKVLGVSQEYFLKLDNSAVDELSSIDDPSVCIEYARGVPRCHANQLLRVVRSLEYQLLIFYNISKSQYDAFVDPRTNPIYVDSFFEGLKRGSLWIFHIKRLQNMMLEMVVAIARRFGPRNSSFVRKVVAEIRGDYEYEFEREHREFFNLINDLGLEAYLEFIAIDDSRPRIEIEREPDPLSDPYPPP